MEYNFSEIEQNWKKYWIDNKVYKVENDTSKPKYYILDMFPYPSGDGLHVGHPLGYVASDIYARYKRLCGYNVLHPMGFDSFGLPAEQYALEKKLHPAVTTEVNIKRYKEQLDNIGFCYDWDREVRTSDPNYYKWTQWIFLQLFHSWYNRKTDKACKIDELTAIFEEEGNQSQPCPADDKCIFTAQDWSNMSVTEQRGIIMKYRLAYQGYAQVWWCEALGTVLANDEVVNGVSERGGHPVERKNMRQWFLRITEFAERLLASLDTLDWSEPMKEMQRNWIGKSNGAEVKFQILTGAPADADVHQVTVFTTRPDTIFGVDFLVLAPEHSLVAQITSDAQKAEVDKYVQYVKSRSERERQAEVKLITGAFTGAYAMHPLTNSPVPVWISEYVLASYGTGAIMGVPSGDERDHRFAKHFNIPITNIFGDSYTGGEAYSDKAGTIQNSGFLSGLSVATAAEAAISTLEKLGAGSRRINYRLRDAGFSRQRYWGEPFPIIYIDGVPYATDEAPITADATLSKLPVELPWVESYGPGSEGQGPLANITDWVNVTSPPAPLHEWRGEQSSNAGALADNDHRPIYSGIPRYIIKVRHSFESARTNRRNLTESEAIVWANIRGNKLGAKFRRQHPIDAYIADFICLQKALIIEIDGEYHDNEEQQKLDNERTRVLEEIGFKVIRFTNEQVGKQLNEVLSAIRKELSSRPNLLTDAVADSDSEFHVTSSPLVERGPGGEVAQRETNTMPGYAGSSWYFLRYMDPNNTAEFASRGATDYWQQVDLYVGGTEHAVGHLLYSRMWTKALCDLGFIGFDEPFKKLLNQGMIQGSSRFVYRVGTDKFVSAGLAKDYDGVPMRVHVDLVDGLELDMERLKNWRPELANATFVTEADGRFLCTAEVEKMSKSKYNVVNPDDIVAKYGADTFRMYEMFLGPIEMSKPWDTKGIEGVHRFLKKMWRLYADEQVGWVVTDDAPTDAELRILHKTIKKIGEDIERFSFNTSVSQFMITVNELSTLGCHKKAILAPLAVLICPFAPHIAEELWHKLGHTTSVVGAAFPVFEQKYVTENTKVYPVAINGKTRCEMEFALDAPQAEIEKEVLGNEIIMKWTEGNAPKKFIYIKGKMINVVI